MYSYQNESFDPRTVTNGGDPRLFGVNMEPNYAAMPTNGFDPNNYLSPELVQQLQMLQLLQQQAQERGILPLDQQSEPQIPVQEDVKTPQPGGIAGKDTRKSSKKGKSVANQSDQSVEQQNSAICEVLNQIAKHEWLGVTVYNHYSLTIGGLPLAVLSDLFAESRDESITHHKKAVDFLLGRGGREILDVSPDADQFDSVPQYSREDPGSLMAILTWSIQHEDRAAQLYGHLAGLVARSDVALLNWAQDQVQLETEGGIEFRKLADLI